MDIGQKQRAKFAGFGLDHDVNLHRADANASLSATQTRFMSQSYDGKEKCRLAR